MSLEEKYKSAMIAAAGQWKTSHGLDPSGAYYGTCQACFKRFVVKNVGGKGRLVTVLHGYERPGHGYITGECPGRGEEPFEVDKTITEKFKVQLVRILANRQEALRKLKAGEIKELFTRITSGYGHNKKVEHKLIQPGWVNPNQSYDDFAGRMKAAIRSTEQEIESIKDNIKFLQMKLDGWKYQPQAMEKHLPVGEIPPTKLTGRSWYDNPKVFAAMRKMPPPAAEPRGSNFREWAETFPRTMMWMGMGGHRTPTYYKRIQSVFSSQPNVDLSLLGAAEKKQQLDDKQIEKEKHVRSVIDAFLGNAAFVNHLKSRNEKASIYNSKTANPPAPGEKSLYDIYLAKITRGESHDKFGDRQFSLKRVISDFKDLVGDTGANIKIKLPRMTKKEG